MIILVLTSLVHKHHSLAQLNCVIAKLSSFIKCKKQYKYFPTTHNVSDEITQSPTKHIPRSSTVADLSPVPPPTFIQPPTSSYML